MMEICYCFTASVRENCDGDSRTDLEMLCMQLPEEDCLTGMEGMLVCEEDEFDCGDGKCIHGLGVCDNTYQCMNGADELMWYVILSSSFGFIPSQGVVARANLFCQFSLSPISFTVTPTTCISSLDISIYIFFGILLLLTRQPHLNHLPPHRAFISYLHMAQPSQSSLSDFALN